MVVVSTCVFHLALPYSWLSLDVINFIGGKLQTDTQSSEGNSFSLYVLTLCLAANMCNFVRFFHFSTA